MDKELGIFAVIPREILLDKRINDKEKFLYAIITGLCRGKRKECFASNAFFCKTLDISPRYLRRCLDHLEKEKLITFKNRGAGRIININWSIRGSGI